jgi:uncharacterized protein (DUF2062 family)
MVRGKIERQWTAIRHGAAVWLRQGITPQRLALTLALGFAIGCFPVIGVPTLLCATLAVALKLNFAAMEAANYAALPFQITLVAPLARVGASYLHIAPRPAMAACPAAQWAAHAASLAGGALLAWLCVAGPLMLLMTAALTLALRRIPAVGASEAGD